MNRVGSVSLPKNQWSPEVDIKEEEKQYVLLAEMPGIATKDIDITFDNNSLTIKGEKKNKIEESKEYHRVETSSGSFTRSFTFPQNINSEGIKAQSKDGILEITIPKKESSLPKKIKIS